MVAAFVLRVLRKAFEKWQDIIETATTFLRKPALSKKLGLTKQLIKARVDQSVDKS